MANTKVKITTLTGEKIIELPMGTMGFQRSKGFLGKAIRWFIEEDYNHAFVIIENWEYPYMVEALGRGVLISQIEPKLETNIRYLLRKPIKPVNKRRFAHMAQSKATVTGYDWISLLFFQAVKQITIKFAKLLFKLGLLSQEKLNNFDGWWIGKRKKRAEEKMYCMEFNAWCYPKYFPKWWEILCSKLIHSDKFETIFEGVILKIEVI